LDDVSRRYREDVAEKVRELRAGARKKRVSVEKVVDRVLTD
jgi:hypothetical protein